LQIGACCLSERTEHGWKGGVNPEPMSPNRPKPDAILYES